MHIEFLVEEESCAEFLNRIAPKILGKRASFRVHPFQGKQNLLQRLPERLQGYRDWIPSDYRIMVLVDRDHDDCAELKAKLERFASERQLITRSTAQRPGKYHVVNRILVEELEAWFFGDVQAIAAAYPGVPATLAEKRGFRDPDAISGGTWEALERVLKSAGYYSTGIPKIEVARKIAERMQPESNRSHSFQVFRAALLEIVS